MKKTKSQPTLFPAKKRRPAKRQPSPPPAPMVRVEPAFHTAVKMHGVSQTLNFIKTICLEESAIARTQKDKPLAKVWARKAKLIDGFRQRIERL